MVGSLSALWVLVAAADGAADVVWSGDPWSGDTVAIGLAAAARSFGLAAEPAEVSCWLGWAFGPCVDQAETCGAWWHRQAWDGDRTLPRAAARLGLAATPVLGPPGLEGDDRRRATAPTVRAALARGDRVLALGGWRPDGPGGLVPWTWAGLITAVGDAGEFIGTVPDGRTGCVLADPKAVWLLRPGDPAPPADDRETVALGLARLRGQEPFAGRRRECYGLAALDAWIARLASEPGFCAACRDSGRGWSCARDNGVTLAAASRAAAGWLRGRRLGWPAPAVAALHRAADRYEAVAGRLERLNGGDGWAALNGDLEDQRRFVDAEIEPVRAALAGVSGDLETALAEAALADVRAAAPPGEVILLEPAIRELAVLGGDGRYYNNRFTSLVYQAALLRVAGAEVTFEALLVAAGYGNSFGYHPQRTHVVYQPPDAPDEVGRRVGGTFGFGWTGLHSGDPEALWSCLRERLTSGVPAQAAWLDDYVFCGLRDATEPADRRVLACGGWDPPRWWTWERFDDWARQFGRLSWCTGPCQRSSEVDTALAQLQRLAGYPEADGRAGVDFLADGLYGFAGLEAYAADLADLSLPPEHWSADWRGCHAVYRQLVGRPALAEWLGQAATRLGPPAAEPLREAAAAYSDAWAEWLTWSAALGQDTRAVGPEVNLEIWADPARRTAGAAAARRAVDHERRGLAAIRRALAAVARSSGL